MHQTHVKTNQVTPPPDYHWIHLGWVLQKGLPSSFAPPLSSEARKHPTKHRIRKCGFLVLGEVGLLLAGGLGGDPQPRSLQAPGTLRAALLAASFMSRDQSRKYRRYERHCHASTDQTPSGPQKCSSSIFAAVKIAEYRITTTPQKESKQS